MNGEESQQCGDDKSETEATRQAGRQTCREDHPIISVRSRVKGRLRRGTENKMKGWNGGADEGDGSDGGEVMDMKTCRRLSCERCRLLTI